VFSARLLNTAHTAYALLPFTQVWDLSAPPQANPLRSLEEHRHEVYSVSWNVVRRDCFLSASWDDTVKLWCVCGWGAVA
jgi:WD40 repeat protein